VTVEAMTVTDAIRELRCHFRRKAQHPHDCICACCEAIEVLALEDAPRGPQWEGLARMMYDSLTCQHRACFFCGRTVGHEDDCQWDALDRLKGDET